MPSAITGHQRGLLNIEKCFLVGWLFVLWLFFSWQPSHCQMRKINCLSCVWGVKLRGTPFFLSIFDFALLFWFGSWKIYCIYYIPVFPALLQGYEGPLRSYPSIHPFSSCLFKSGYASRTSRAAPNVFSFRNPLQLLLGCYQTLPGQLGNGLWSLKKVCPANCSQTVMPGTEHLQNEAPEGGIFQGAQNTPVAPHTVVQQQLDSKVLTHCSFLTMSTTHTYRF